MQYSGGLKCELSRSDSRSEHTPRISAGGLRDQAQCYAGQQ